MRLPLSWLSEFVALDFPVEEVVDAMDRGGLEVEAVHRPGAAVRGVRTARVVEVRDHPDADTLVLVTVDDGESQREVVCGARNFAAGDVVPLAAPGAVLPGGMEIERRTIRGATSEGMLCSPRELQVADDHSGILVLPGQTPVGTDLAEVLALGEPVIELAPSTDRGDHLSVVGVARDLAALLGVELRPPAEGELSAGGDVPVEITATGGCSHYVGWVVEGVAAGPSPWWLRRRLEACGVRSLDVLVDVTNYVMLELGQPLHAFDLERLHGPEITVRWAEAGEQLTTLDGVARHLEADDLVIADADRAVALAGVMGGADTEVGQATTSILLEAAVFDPYAVRRTSRRLRLVSESSVRFERGVDPAGARRAAARAVGLYRELAGGRDAGAAEAGGPLEGRDPVDLDPVWCARFLGLADLTAEDQQGLLERAGCGVARNGQRLAVTPPTWRGDLARAADLAEEVVRLYGYEEVPATLPRISLRGGLTRRQRAEREVREAARAGGFHEVQTRPFTARSALEGVVPGEDRVVLANPVSRDADALRPSLLEGLLSVVRHNVGQGQPGVAVFELGRVFRPAGGPLDARLKAFGDGWRWEGPDASALPTQPRALGLAAQGRRHGPGWVDREGTWSVFDLLAVLDEVTARLDPPGGALGRVPVDRAGLHPGRSAALRLAGTEVGLVGQLHPEEATRRDLPEPVVVAELLLEPLWEHLEADLEPRRAPELVRHPAMIIDVALAADEQVPYAELEAALRRGAGDLLDGLWWFDEYRGEQVGEGRRSVAVRLRLQSAERQLTDEDAEAVIDRIAEAAAEVPATLRR